MQRLRILMSQVQQPSIYNGELLMDKASNGLVHFRLNRPDRLNALSMDQVNTIAEYLPSLASNAACSAILVTGEGDKAFCAGGDVRKIMDESNSGWCLRWFANEYKMNYRIANFPKPYISLWHGFVMGGGVGISVHGSIRVATEKTMFAMPETAIGLIPDVGGTFMLSRLPHPGLGQFLGLSGHRLNGTDCVEFGVATHFVEKAKLPDLTEKLRSEDLAGQRAAEIVQSFASVPSAPTSLDAASLAMIDRCFTAPTVAEVLARLEKEEGELAEKTLKNLRRYCPTSICATFQAINQAKHKTLKECLEVEYKLCSWMTHENNYNFSEGVTCLLLEKGRTPVWRPATIEDVTEEHLEDVFRGKPGDDLDL